VKIVNQALAFVKHNSPVILSSAAVVGVVSTSYLAIRASFQASERIRAKEFTAGPHREPKQRFKERAGYCWTLYIPAGVSAVMTIGCIVGSTKIGNKRAVAAQAAFILTERAYSEYRDKVIEEFGEKGDRKVRDKVAEDRVRNNPPAGQEVVLAGSGNVLCCELYTGRYFLSDMETLRKAVNDLNSMLIRQDYASMEEFYYLIGLQPTDFSSDVGWNSDKLMELEFSPVIAEDGRPCLAFSYKHFRSLHEGMFHELH
jgi:hypothetical protein